MTPLDLTEIGFRTKKATGEQVSVDDVCFFLIEELSGDKASAYVLTKAKTLKDRRSVSSSANLFSTKYAYKGKYVKEHLKPVLKEWVDTYIRENYDALEPTIQELYKKYNGTDPSDVNLEDYDEVELTDSFFRKTLSRVLTTLSNSTLDKDTISSTIQTIKLLREKFNTDDKDDKVVIELPAPFTKVCPNCHREV